MTTPNSNKGTTTKPDGSTDHAKDEDMTPQEREEWLRQRGIQIETPADRRKASAAAAAAAGELSIIQQMHLRGDNDNSDSDQPSKLSSNSVKFVCIPADDSMPLRTLILPESFRKNTPGDALPEYVKPYFASDRTSIDATLLKEQAMKQFAGGDLEQLAQTKLSTEAMNAVSAQGSVETFPLVHPADTNKMTGVYIYLDEVGLLKKLPTNRRAAQIAESCGYNPAPAFYGDVFVGRVKTQPNLENIDFVAGVDTDRGSEWIQRAVPENLAWQQEMNKITGQVGQTQIGQAGTDGTAATEDGFTWTQGDDELEIVLSNLAPGGSSLSKSAVNVTFRPRFIKVLYSGTEKLSLSLYDAVDVDGCTWTLDGDKLVVTCEKASEGVWPRIKLNK